MRTSQACSHSLVHEALSSSAPSLDETHTWLPPQSRPAALSVPPKTPAPALQGMLFPALPSSPAAGLCSNVTCSESLSWPPHHPPPVSSSWLSHVDPFCLPHWSGTPLDRESFHWFGSLLDPQSLDTAAENLSGECSLYSSPPPHRSRVHRLWPTPHPMLGLTFSWAPGFMVAVVSLLSASRPT